jgi:hypothetical protein
MQASIVIDIEFVLACIHVLILTLYRVCVRLLVLCFVCIGVDVVRAVANPIRSSDARR